MEGVEIPSHFLCPISLQLMRDPVIVSTGITYDRESIEKWLFSCKNATCPVTKQPLITSPLDQQENDDHDHDLNVMIITPNHTLRRLIQSWCTLHASDGVERIPTPKQPPTVDRAHVTKLLSDARKSPELRYSCLQRIRSLLVSRETRTKKLLQACGAFGYVASILMGDDHVRREKEEALYILAQLEGDDGELIKQLFKNCEDEELFVDSLIEFMKSGSAETRECVVKLLKSTYTVADPNQLANVKRQLLGECIQLIRDRANNSQQGVKNALKLLGELNPWGRNRVKAAQCGAVSALVEVLIDGSDRRACELALVVLDQLCGCAEGRADLVGHGAGLAVVSKKILRVSHLASDRAVRILSSISRYSATGKVVGEMMEVGVVAKLCLVIQVDCNAKTKERAKEILRLHSRVWKMSPCIPPHLLSAYPA